MPVELRRTTDFLPLIMPYCRSCPDYLAEQMVRLAAIDFSERSRAWRHIISVQVGDGEPEMILTGTLNGKEVDLLFVVSPDEYTATAGSVPADLPLDTPPLTAIHEFEYAELNGRPLDPIQFSTMNASRRGAARYITQIAPGVVTLVPFEAGVLEMSVFLKPAGNVQYGTDAATPLFDRYNVVPDFYLSMHGQALAAGALARILSIPDEPWTDKQEAMKYGAMFSEKLDSAFRANMRGQQRAPIRTKPRWF